MAGEEVRIGPFVGGLNKQSDPTSIGDTELAEIVNFEQDEDGSLVNRPPIVEATSLPTGTPKILGHYSTAGGVHRVIATDQINKTYWYNGTTWTLLAGINATAIAQYKDVLWLICGPNDTAKGGKWTPATGFTADANMPNGSAMAVHKDRIWIVPGKTATSNGSRLYLSAIVSADISWPVSPIIVNVGQGDGQNLVDILVYNSDLVLFKERSTHRFSYSADPAMGALQRVSATIGATDSKCVVEWQNQLFVLFQNKVFEFSNYLFDEINQKVPLTANNPSSLITQPSSLSAWADRLFVTYYNSTYVYNIKYRVWSRWETKIPGLEFFGGAVPELSARPELPSALITSRGAVNPKIYRVVDAITAAAENMDCYFETKNYDYNSASRQKRLFWVGMDVVANVALTITARPVQFARQVTWAEMKLRLWSDVKKHTWGRLVDSDISVTDTVNVSSSTYGRKMLKVITSLRFRQISFKVSATTKGDSATAPLRIFTLTTFVRDKQYVSKKIS